MNKYFTYCHDPPKCSVFPEFYSYLKINNYNFVEIFQPVAKIDGVYNAVSDCYDKGYLFFIDAMDSIQIHFLHEDESKTTDRLKTAKSYWIRCSNEDLKRFRPNLRDYIQNTLLLK